MAGAGRTIHTDTTSHTDTVRTHSPALHKKSANSFLRFRIRSAISNCPFGGIFNMTNRTAATLAVLIFCAGIPARATVAFNNLAEPNVGNRTAFSTPQYQSFSTPGSVFLLADVQLLLTGPGSSDTASFTVGLYADSSTSPGTLLNTLGTLTDNSVPGSGFTIEDFSFSPISLSANTRYWIGISSSNGSLAEWSLGFGPTAGDVGVAGEFTDDSGSVSSTAFPGSHTLAFQMQVMDGPATPEPSTIVLGLSGLVLLAAWKRR